MSTAANDGDWFLTEQQLDSHQQIGNLLVLLPEGEAMLLLGTALCWLLIDLAHGAPDDDWESLYLAARAKNARDARRALLDQLERLVKGDDPAGEG